MAGTVTIKDLERMALRVNIALGRPVKAYAEISTGEYRAEVGNYHIDSNGCGVSLVCMCNTAGGVQTILGPRPKRELADLISAYLKGIYDGREQP
jgi:hypothetical protein